MASDTGIEQKPGIGRFIWGALLVVGAVTAFLYADGFFDDTRLNDALVTVTDPTRSLE